MWVAFNWFLYRQFHCALDEIRQKFVGHLSLFDNIQQVLINEDHYHRSWPAVLHLQHRGNLQSSG
jgi:hypothetical protein